MTTNLATRTLTVALLGNPNVGKSTLFNALAGVRQRVGNYPGVTVDKKIGRLTVDGQPFDVVDLPGTYSLAPRSPDEMVAVDVLLGRRSDVAPPDAVICIVDASNLERNLYLASQVLELGLPTVLALNMIDVARARGVQIDIQQLSRRLGVPVVELAAHRREGLDRLKHALAHVSQTSAPQPLSPLPEAVAVEVVQLSEQLNANSSAREETRQTLPRYLVERLLIDAGGYTEQVLLADVAQWTNRAAVESELAAARSRLREVGCPVPAIEPISRYAWIGRTLDGVIRRPSQTPKSKGDVLDRLLTHKWWGVLIFVALMVVIFQSVFSWAVPAMDLIDGGVGWVSGHLERLLAEGPLASLLIDGVLAGVGGVLVFLPQIFILFFFLALLEDCGYMARAAFLMDKLMVHVGLSGKSFVPLLSSFACAIPGIMATRVIENPRDRLTTILVAPLMSCSARLPVYTLLIAAFIPQRALLSGWVGLQGLVMASMYLLGILTAVVVALLLKRTLLRGPTPPLVMELPAYKWPSPANVLYRMGERGWAFVRRAGTLILAVSILVWAGLYFPRDSEQVEAPLAPQTQALTAKAESLAEDDPQRAEIEDELRELQNQIDAAYVRDSYLGRVGRAIEPVFHPLGWDWKIGCAVIASFPAREVVVAVLGVIYELGSEVDPGDEESQTRMTAALRSATWEGSNRPVFTIPVALSIMVFFALCAQCAATLVVMRRETNSWRWPLFAFTYMTTLAYLGALITYQVGSRIAG